MLKYLVLIAFIIGVESKNIQQGTGRELLQNDDSVIRLNLSNCNSKNQDCPGSLCSDEKPPEAPFECQRYFELGICTGIPENYCKKSCGRCTNLSEVLCEDVLLPGTSDCTLILQSNLCEEKDIKGKFCVKSCGQCNTTTQKRQNEQMPETVAAPPEPLVEAASGCADVLPRGSSDCSMIVDTGLCNKEGVKGIYCAQSCGTCNSIEQLIFGPEPASEPTLEPLSEQIIETGDCDDEEPPNAPFNCSTYFESGLCAVVDEQFCQISCGRCVGSSSEFVEFCEDTYLPGTSDCSIILEQDMCEEPAIKNIYCNKSCNQCELNEQTECEDVLLPGTSDCSLILETNICEDEGIKGIYCANSCGTCSKIDNGSAVVVPESEPVEPSPQADICSNSEQLDCDSQALFAFKWQLASGQELLSSWNETANTCDWRYIVCQKVDGKNSRVVSLQMNFYNTPDEFTMSGTLVKDFSKLRFLKTLVIGASNINGELPKEYSILEKLTEFQLFRNGFSGVLPGEWSVWKSLKEFSVYLNSLSSTLPKEYSAWERIKQIYLGSNMFSGTLPEQYSVWKSIEDFTVEENQFTGTLPVQYSEWTSSKNLHFDANFFTGTMPPQYSTFIEIKQFLADSNKMSGILPVEFSTWSNCQYFFGYDNRFSGTLPVQYSTMVSMISFQYSFNDISGSLPAEYSVMTNLKQFQFEDTMISDAIPIEWSDLEQTAEIRV